MAYHYITTTDQLKRIFPNSIDIGEQWMLAGTTTGFTTVHHVGPDGANFIARNLLVLKVGHVDGDIKHVLGYVGAVPEDTWTNNRPACLEQIARFGKAYQDWDTQLRAQGIKLLASWPPE